MMGDFDVDINEKALCSAVALLRTGVVNRMSVIANIGDSTMRAGLAKDVFRAGLWATKEISSLTAGAWHLRMSSIREEDMS